MTTETRGGTEVLFLPPPPTGSAGSEAARSPRLRADRTVMQTTEEAVVAAWLIGGPRHEEALALVAASLDPRDITDVRARTVYEAAVRLQRLGRAHDVMLVVDELEREGRLGDAGGIEYVASLVDVVPTANHVEDHARALAEHAKRQRYRDVLRTALRDVDEDGTHDVQTLAAQHAARLADLGERSKRCQTWATLADLQTRPELLTQPECVVPRLAYRGRLSILAAPAKGGKSTLAGHALAGLTRRRTWLGEHGGVRYGTGVLLGLEEALGDAVRRLVDQDADPECVQLLVAAHPDLLGQTHALLAHWRADLVVVDSLAEYARVTLGQAPEDGDTALWGALVRPWAALAREHDVAVLLLHHARRSDGRYRGAEEIAAAADAMYEMYMPGKEADPFSRRIEGRGRWAIEPYTITLVDGRYRLAGGGTLSLDARVLLAIEAEPGCSLRTVRSRVMGRPQAIAEAVRDLISRGAIEDRGDGDRMVLYPAGAPHSSEPA